MNPGPSDSNQSTPDPSSEDASDVVDLNVPEPILRRVRVMPERAAASVTEPAVDEELLPPEEEPILLEVDSDQGAGRKFRLNQSRPMTGGGDSEDLLQQSQKLEPWEIEGKEWGKQKRFDWRWIVGIVIAMIALLVVCLALLPWINKGNAAPNPDSSKLAIEQKLAVERQSMIEDLLLNQSEAQKMFYVYASATKVDDFIDLVRDRDRLEPLIRSSWKSPLIPKTWKRIEEDPWSVRFVDSKPYGCLNGPLPDYSNYAAYFVIQDGKFLLDWEATTAYSKATFEELEKGTGDTSEIRGIIKPALFYTDVFPERNFQSYQLLSPNQEHIIWCYVPRKSAMQERFQKMFLGGDILRHEVVPIKVTLRLKSPPQGARANQWIIDEFLYQDWVEL